MPSQADVVEVSCCAIFLAFPHSSFYKFSCGYSDSFGDYTQSNLALKR